MAAAPDDGPSHGRDLLNAEFGVRNSEYLMSDPQTYERTPITYEILLWADDHFMINKLVDGNCALCEHFATLRQALDRIAELEQE